jgi:hypothetical protein
LFGHKKYYVFFIDDYSKFTWIYLLRKKIDVFKYFRKIIFLQSDWGGEYKRLNSLFRKIGISHQVSCPYTHQQNRVAECKHHHTVEMDLTLLAHASMPLKYWDETFLAAVYLINYTPTKLLSYNTLSSSSSKSHLDYSSFHVFWCVCWHNLRSYNSHKLQLCSIRCVFLGYNNMHKGFKSLDISKGHIYIYWEVIFDESIFPFASLHSNADTRYANNVLLSSSRNNVTSPPLKGRLVTTKIITGCHYLSNNV